MSAASYSEQRRGLGMLGSDWEWLGVFGRDWECLQPLTRNNDVVWECLGAIIFHEDSHGVMIFHDDSQEVVGSDWERSSVLKRSGAAWGLWLAGSDVHRKSIGVTLGVFGRDWECLQPLPWDNDVAGNAWER